MPPRPFLTTAALTVAGGAALVAATMTGAADYVVPVVWAESAESCGAYAGSSTYSFCLQRVSAQAARLEEMVGICAGSGEWEVECRVAWVRAHINDRRTSRELLVAGCGGDPDCLFVVTDLRPSGTVIEQLNDCATLVRPFLGDCAGHTLRRHHPLTASTGLQEAIAEAEPWMNPHLAAWGGVAVACGGPGSCADLGPLAKACEPWRARYEKNPEACPSLTPRHEPMQTRN